MKWSSPACPRWPRWWRSSVPRSSAPTARSTAPRWPSGRSSTEESQKKLEAITHPAIGEEFLRQVAAAPPDGIVVHDVPLLVESKRGIEYGGVIVVEAPREVRLERLERRGVPRDDAERRMAHQATDEERAAVATWLVDNNGDLAHLERQIDAIWPELEARAKERPETACANGEPAKPGG